MARITKIKATKVVKDYNLYPRQSVDAYHVREIRNALQAGTALPPIILDKASLRVVDGFHRLAAYQQEHGPDAEIPCEYREYADEKEIFRDALICNSAHGRALTVYDKARAVGIGDNLGLSRDVLSGALHITKDRIEKLLLSRITASGDVVKQTMAHFAGREMTSAQRDFNRNRAGGLDQLFYINQVVALLETNSIDWDRDKVVAGLRHLGGLLEKELAAIK